MLHYDLVALVSWNGHAGTFFGGSLRRVVLADYNVWVVGGWLGLLVSLSEVFLTERTECKHAL